MNLDGELHDMANNPPNSDEPTASDPIVRSVTTKAGWVQRVVQRWLGTGSGPETEPALPARKYNQTGLTTPSTTSLLSRLQRTADQSAIWRPNVGSLNPIQVDRFTSDIVARFPAMGSKYQPQSLESSSAEAADLTLAGLSGESSPEAEPTPPTPSRLPFSVEQVRQALEGGGSLSPSSTSTPPPASQPAPPPIQRTAAPEPGRDRSLPFTVAEVRAALEQPLFTRAPATPAQPPANIQRTATEPPHPDQPARPLPPRTRRFSRIEELPTPKSSTSPTSLPVNEMPDQSDSLMDSSGGLDLPAGSTPPSMPPPIQRQMQEEAFPTPSMPAPPSTQPESGRPEETIQRSIESELPLQKPPVSSTPAEKLPGSIADSAIHSPEAEPSTSTPEPVRPIQPAIQRQPEPELTLREPTPPTTSTETPAGEVAKPIEPVAQLGETATPASEPARPVQPTIQWQPEPELTLREPTLPTTSTEMPAGEVAKPIEPVTQLDETATPASEPARPVQPTIQRQPEPELTLREPTLPTTSTETPAGETATPTSEPARPVQPTIQRQPELTLREPTPPTTSTETPAGEAAKPIEPVTRLSEPSAPTSEPARPVQPTIQRQPELTLREPTPSTTSTEMPAGEAAKPAEPVTRFTQAEGFTPSPATEAAAVEPSAPTSEPARPVQPTIQRQPEPELTLREPTPPTTSTEMPAGEVAKPVEPVTQLGETATPASEPARPVQPTIQRQPEPELTLREPTPPTTSTETPAGEVAKPAEPATRLSEPSAPTSEPARPVQPTIQRQPEPELTLRKPAPLPETTEKLTSETVTPTGSSQLAEIKDTRPGATQPEVAPEPKPGRVVQPALQRQAAPDLEMPLRSPAVQSSQTEPQPGETSEITTGLEGDILARAATGSHLPLTEPFVAPSGDLTKSRPPDQMAVLPQARLQTKPATERTVVPAEQSLPVPLPPASSAASTDMPTLPIAGPVRIQMSASESDRVRKASSPRPPTSSPSSMVQRQPAGSAVSQSVESPAAAVSSDLIQREETESTTPSLASSSASQPATDLDKLARQIYPLLKRMLAVERERRPRY